MSAFPGLLVPTPNSKRVMWGLIASQVLLAVLLLAFPNQIGSGGGTDLTQQSTEDVLRRGFAAQALGRDDDAAAAYETVLESNPNNTVANYNLGVIEHKRRNRDQAQEFYETALSSDPNFVPALFNLAILREENGQLQESERLYRKIVEVDPGMAKAHLNLGFLLLRKLDRPDEGKAEIIRAIELDRSLASRVPADEVPEANTSP